MGLLVERRSAERIQLEFVVGDMPIEEMPRVWEKPSWSLWLRRGSWVLV